ncbi:hypothetical protein V9T40_014432 [Parthenolecanium corni]|uniref:Phosphatidylinositol-3-phosphatase SAC1 n=1 Tax=Parthenolecanium corni TaxID=536013 RepID=A0AAN9T6V6_9HEMI
METFDLKTESGKHSKLFDNLNLYTTNESYYLQPIENESVLLHIDRLNQDMSLQTNNGQIPPTANMMTIFGVLGRIKLLAGYYLIVITERKLMGQICGHDIWKIENVEIIQFPKTLLHLTQKQEEANKMYVSMLKHVFSTPDFYYSYTYDITYSLQRLHNTPPDFVTIPMFRRADPRFIWNSYLLEQFCIVQDLHKFCVPVIHGFVSINPYSFEYNGVPDVNTFTWTILSRRSCYRAGTRLYKRGIESTGDVANFVETEQIVEFDGAQSSFVQIRGSIPLFWHQYPNLKLKPQPVIIPAEHHLEACRKHLHDITNIYGNVVMVNLIDHKGREGELQQKFKTIIDDAGFKKVRYEAYDFHRECKNMQWHKLNALIDKISSEQDQFRFFLLDKDRKLVSLQTGVFRTNCIDCLDRTNVVQSMIAWRSLSNILQHFGIISESREIRGEVSFYRLFQRVWADHADHISIQYSGTGALKTDYTRTGKRTYVGALRDGYNSLLRYYKNNLKDGFRQDSIDLLLGKYVTREGECVSEVCPLKTSPSWKSIMFQMILLFAIAMFFANTIFPAEYSTSTCLSIFFWGAMIFVTMSTIIYYGSEFVDYPKLCPRFSRENEITHPFDEIPDDEHVYLGESFEA